MFCDYLEFVTGHGGRISVKPGDIEINTPQNVEALKSMVDLIHTHKVTPPPEEILAYNETISERLFKQGKTAFLRTWQTFSHFAHVYPTRVIDRVDFDAMPGKNKDLYGSTLGGWTLALSNYSRHPRKAWKFIKYMVSRENQKHRLHYMQFPSRRLSAMERELGEGGMQIARMQSYLEDVTPRPATPFYRVISLIFQKYLHQALENKISPDDAMKAIETDITMFMDEVGPILSDLASLEHLPLSARRKDLVETHKNFLKTYLEYIQTLSKSSLDSKLVKDAFQSFKVSMDIYYRKYQEAEEEKLKIDKGTLRYAMGPDITTFDPHDAMDDPTFRIHKNIYDTLVELDSSMTVVPLLATAWECSENGLSWTFSLNKNVTFHDGTPFNARAVKENFDRLLDGGNKLRRRSVFSSISAVDVIDEHTVRITTENPFAPLLNYLAHNAGSMISPAVLKEWKATGEFRPVGTGPYRFTEWQPGKHVLLEQNKNYFRGRPGIPRLTYFPIPDDDLRANYLETGRADIIYPVPSWKIIPFKAKDNIRILEKESLRTLYLGFNTSKAPFDDIKLRKAVASAIDTREILWSDLRGHARIATSSLAPEVTGYTSTGTYEFNLERSMELLSQVDKIDGFSCDLIVPKGRFFMAESIAESIKESLQIVDIQVNVRTLEWNDYEHELSRPPEEATHQMYIFGWSPTSGDADNVLRLIFHSDAFAPGGANRMFYQNKAVDQLIEKALVSTEPDKRTSLYSQIQKIIFQDVPCIPLFVLNQTFAVSKRVTGLELIPNEIIHMKNATFGRPK